MSAPRLRVLVVAAETSDSAFAQRVLDDNGDRAETCTDVPEALARLSQEKFDLALVSLSMPRGDGLALVHHLRALYPELDVVVMSTADEVEEAASAMALGVLSTMVTPLTGDEILVAADRVRERRLLISERMNLRAKVASSARRNETYARCAAFVAEADTSLAALRVLEACAAEVDIESGGLYLVDARQERYYRVAKNGSDTSLPEQILGKDIHVAKGESLGQVGDEIHLLLHSGESRVGLVVLKSKQSTPISLEAHELLEVVVRLASAALTAARRVEAIARGGIKDPDTGAYTFAYFGDVASREIDRAIRHHRAFALLTLQISGVSELANELSMTELAGLRRLTTQCVLASVRDSDMVARVDDDQYYLLLPETGLLGALACRRRILERLKSLPKDVERSMPGLDRRVDIAHLVASVGISAFPRDGADLSLLIKLSRRRSDRARESDWYRLGLDGLPFWDAVAKLVQSEGGDDGLGAHARMPLELVTRITLSLIRDAYRENSAGTLYLAGDAELSAQVAREALTAHDPALRTWLLGPSPSVRDPAAELRLPIADPRLKQTALVLCITERCGYCLVARGSEAGQVVAYHSSDLELVEGLVNALQTTYHLQPELR
jgi:DNA-binding NarL/FixJ family response regulator/GGDEF domain-containing protein